MKQMIQFSLDREFAALIMAAYMNVVVRTLKLEGKEHRDQQRVCEKLIEISDTINLDKRHEEFNETVRVILRAILNTEYSL